MKSALALLTANHWIEDAIADGKWIVPMVHGISDGFRAFKNPADFDVHLLYVNGCKNRIWADTFANVSKYVQERDAATLKADVAADKATFTLTCPLDPAVFNVPLTVLIPASNARQAYAVRGTIALPVVVSNGQIQVEVVPGAEAVTVTWQ